MDAIFNRDAVRIPSTDRKKVVVTRRFEHLRAAWIEVPLESGSAAVTPGAPR